MADFLTGDIFTFEQSNLVHQGNKKNFYALYAQDSWQINRKLTLNYGLRWEPFTAQQNAAGEGYSFSLPAFEAGIHSTVFTNAPAGLLFPGDRGGPGTGASYVGDWKHFEPRIGLSWILAAKGARWFAPPTDRSMISNPFNNNKTSPIVRPGQIAFC